MKRRRRSVPSSTPPISARMPATTAPVARPRHTTAGGWSRGSGSPGLGVSSTSRTIGRSSAGAAGIASSVSPSAIRTTSRPVVPSPARRSSSRAWPSSSASAWPCAARTVAWAMVATSSRSRWRTQPGGDGASIHVALTSSLGAGLPRQAPSASASPSPTPSRAAGGRAVNAPRPSRRPVTAPRAAAARSRRSSPRWRCSSRRGGSGCRSCRWTCRVRPRPRRRRSPASAGWSPRSCTGRAA